MRVRLEKKASTGGTRGKFYRRGLERRYILKDLFKKKRERK